MKLNRRIFFSALFFAKPRRPVSHEVEVLETFEFDGRSVAILAHHAGAASRQTFAAWLQDNPNTSARVRTGAGLESRAAVFRVRMCFGRALILPQQPMQIRRGELLTLQT
jgi:hypothetical protein